jgi:PPM family protein phosphatase
MMIGTYTSGAATDTGLLRDHNEDRYWIDPEHGVFLVVDGVGGHAAGELAAETAVESIRESLADPSVAVEQRVRTAITNANNRIFELAAKEEEHAGMACVLTLAVVENGEMTVGHVGDSRLYLIWEGAIRKITSDHSPVGESEEAGELTEEEAMLHPRRNEVFRDVGSQARADADEDFIEIRKCRFRDDAAVLLCSDGLTDQLTSTQVRDIVETYNGDAARVAQELVEAANAAGGRDNITAVFVAGPEFRGRSGATRPRFATTRIRAPRRFFTGRIAFLAYGILIGMLLWAVLQVTRG